MELRVDGRRVFAYTAAHALDPAKATIVFLHGSGLDHSLFGLQSRYFGYHGRNVLAVDCPGHGRSDGPPLATIETLADWAVRVLDAAGFARAAIVGHSMGALAAIECAARHPARIERIALLGAAFPMKVSEVFLAAARSNDPAAYDMATVWGHGLRAALGANPSPGMSMYGYSLARLGRLAPDAYYTALKVCDDYAGGLESAARVKCPVLLILGRQDQMAPVKAGRALAAAIPGARVLELPRSGHSMMTEEPDAVLDALIEFLA